MNNEIGWLNFGFGYLITRHQFCMDEPGTSTFCWKTLLKIRGNWGTHARFQIQFNFLSNSSLHCFMLPSLHSFPPWLPVLLLSSLPSLLASLTLLVSHFIFFLSFPAYLLLPVSFSISSLPLVTIALYSLNHRCLCANNELLCTFFRSSDKAKNHCCTNTHSKPHIYIFPVNKNAARRQQKITDITDKPDLGRGIKEP